MEPGNLVQRIEEDPSLPSGAGERFAGFAVIGLPFRSGHVLALRRFPASSIGPGYTSVWHRDPQGAWTFYSTVAPDLGCSRYWGPEVTRDVLSPITIEWTGPARFSVSAGSELRWEVRLAGSFLTRALNAATRLVPEAWWRRRFMLSVTGSAARLLLRAGKMNLAGETPNGYEFIANPQRVWLIESSQAVLNGRDLGPIGPLPRQARLGQFLIPQRGLFAVTRAFLRAPREVPHASALFPVRGPSSPSP